MLCGLGFSVKCPAGGDEQVQGGGPRQEQEVARPDHHECKDDGLPGAVG